MDNVDNEVLVVNVGELRTDSFQNVTHCLTGLIVEPFRSEKIWVIISKHIYKDDLYYYVDKARN